MPHAMDEARVPSHGRRKLAPCRTSVRNHNQGALASARMFTTSTVPIKKCGEEQKHETCQFREMA